MQHTVCWVHDEPVSAPITVMGSQVNPANTVVPSRRLRTLPPASELRPNPLCKQIDSLNVQGKAGGRYVLPCTGSCCNKTGIQCCKSCYHSNWAQRRRLQRGQQRGEEWQGERTSLTVEWIFGELRSWVLKTSRLISPPFIQ